MTKRDHLKIFCICITIIVIAIILVAILSTKLGELILLCLFIFGVLYLIVFLIYFSLHADNSDDGEGES